MWKIWEIDLTDIQNNTAAAFCIRIIYSTFTTSRQTCWDADIIAKPERVSLFFIKLWLWWEWWVRQCHIFLRKLWNKEIKSLKFTEVNNFGWWFNQLMVIMPSRQYDIKFGIFLVDAWFEKWEETPIKTDRFNFPRASIKIIDFDDSDNRSFANILFRFCYCRWIFFWSVLNCFYVDIDALLLRGTSICLFCDLCDRSVLLFATTCVSTDTLYFWSNAYGRSVQS